MPGSGLIHKYPALHLWHIPSWRLEQWQVFSWGMLDVKPVAQRLG
jgi:hypothetical protein